MGGGFFNKRFASGNADTSRAGLDGVLRFTLFTLGAIAKQNCEIIKSERLLEQNMKHWTKTYGARAGTEMQQCYTELIM